LRSSFTSFLKNSR